MLALSSLSSSSLVAQSLMYDGGQRLCDLQADITEDNAGNGVNDDDPDDGGWDWTIKSINLQHSSNPSPTNLFGMTASGVLWALKSPVAGGGGAMSPPPGTVSFAGFDNWGGFQQAGPGAWIGDRCFQTVLDAMTGIASNPEIDSAPDFVFLVILDRSGPWSGLGSATLARARYDAKLSSHGGALALGETIRDSRGSASQDGFILYDLWWFTHAALEIDATFPGEGYDQDATTFAQIIVDDINNPQGYFQIDDPNEFGRIIGLACGAAALTKTEMAPSLRDDMYNALVPLQKLNGSFPWNGIYTSADLQSSAYAVISLALSMDPGHLTVAQDAADWLASKQDEDGGWTTGVKDECPALNAEVLTALYHIPASGLKDGHTKTLVQPELDLRRIKGPECHVRGQNLCWPEPHPPLALPAR